MPDTHPSPWLRRVAWLLGGFVGLVALILVAAGLYTRTRHFQDLLRTQALAALRSSLHADVSLGGVSGSVWNTLVLHDLTIRQNDVETLTVPKATISLRLLAQVRSFLSSSTIHIDQLTVTAPTMRLVQHADGSWNVATLAPPADTAQPPPSQLHLLVDDLRLEQGEIFIRQATGEESHLTALTTAGSLAVVPAGLQAELSTLTFALTRSGLPELQWSSEVTYDTTQSPSLVSIAQGDLRTSSSHLRLSGDVHNLSAPVVALTADLERLSTQDVTSLAPTLPLQQDLSGRIHMSGPLSALQIAAEVQAPDGRAAATVTANVSHTPPHYQGAVTIERFAPQRVFHLPTVSGLLNGRATFSGETLLTGQGEAQLQASNLHVQEREIGSVTTSGRLENGVVTLQGNTQGGLGETSWQGYVNLNEPLAYEVNLAARKLAVAQATGKSDLPPAQINVDGWVKGSGSTLQTLHGAAQVTMLPSTIGTLTNVTGRLLGSFHQQQLTLDVFEVTANETTVTAHGSLGGLQQQPQGTLTYTAVTQNLSPWLALTGQDGGGALRLEGAVSGALTAPQVKGKATLTNLQVGTSSLRSGTLTYAANALGSPDTTGHITAALQQMDAGIPWSTVTVDVTFTGWQPMTLHTSLIGQDTQKRTHTLATQIRYQPDRLEVRIEKLSAQLPTGTWKIAQPAMVLLHSGALTVSDFLVRQASQSISIDGTVSRQGAQSLQLTLTQFPFSDLRALLGKGPEVGGRLNAEARIQGVAAAPDIQATVNTSALTIAGQPYAGLTMRAVYRQQQLTLDGQFRQDDAHSLTISGGLPVSLAWAEGFSYTAPGEADLRLRSTGLSLAFLNMLSTTTAQDIQGTLSMDVQVRGPLQRLTPSGTVQVQGGQVRLKPLGVMFERIGARAELTPGAIKISQLAIHAGEGQITGNGQLFLEQYALTRFALTFDAERFRAVHTRQYATAVSGHLRGSGSLTEPLVQGELQLEDTTLRPDLSLLKSGPAKPDPTIIVVHTAEESSSTQESQPADAAVAPKDNPILTSTPYQRLSADVTVTIPRGTWVYLDEGTVELMGQVRVQKKPQQDAFLVGTIETVRGWYSYRGRKFQLERGQVIFTGGAPIDPALDVVARNKVGEYQIDIIVNGTARSPVLTLQSDPRLEQADILSMLVFGKTTGGLNQGEKVQLQSQVLSATAGYFANDLRRSVAEELGIDNLEFDVGQSLGQSRIGAGKYLSEDVFVSTSQSFSDKNGREFSLEYNLGENWQLKASTTTRGNDGVDVVWRKRY